MNLYAQQVGKATKVDFAKVKGEMIPLWAWFGYDEPNYTYMKDGHSLLSSGDGTPALKWGSTNAYTEDANGNPVYNWKIVDSIFDTYFSAK